MSLCLNLVVYIYIYTWGILNPLYVCDFLCRPVNQGFDNVQVLYILSKGLVALNSRVISGGAVWGEDFVLSDATLIHPVRGFALTYLEVLHLTRHNFMKAGMG